MQIYKEVGIIGSFTRKSQKMLFQYPNLILTKENSFKFLEAFKETLKSKKSIRKKKIDQKKANREKSKKRKHFHCSTLRQNPVLEEMLRTEGDSPQGNHTFDAFNFLTKYFQSTKLGGQLSNEKLLQVDRTKMLLLINKKQEEGFHVFRIEDVTLFGFRKKVGPLFEKDLDKTSELNLSYFLSKSTNFRTMSEEHNIKTRPVLKSFFIYFAEKKTKGPKKGVRGPPVDYSWVCQDCASREVDLKSKMTTNLFE